MEAQGAKTKQPKSASSFPLDLISEILLRLPWKSVVRFRCVSKLWLSIATAPYLAKSFETRSSTRPSLLLCFKEKGKMFVFSTPQRHENSNERYSSSLPIECYSRFSPTESVQGLVCFEESARVIVWNPSTTQFLTLPEPFEENWKDITVFLGYDPIESKHKVVCVSRGITSEYCRVLTLGSAQESWRWIKTNYIHQSEYGRYGRCINGVLYYLAYTNQPDVRFIMSFDVRSEKVNKIVLPLDIHNKDVLLLAYNGRLACLAQNSDMLSYNDGIKLWILEDAEKHKWSSKDFLAPFHHYDLSSGITATLNGISHAGEIIYAPLGFCRSFFTIFYDPVKNSFRKVEFTVDDILLSHGVPRGRIYILHAFANHIDNLMSF